jgi:hypothetical protein
MDVPPIPSDRPPTDSLRLRAHELREAARSMVVRSIELRAESRRLSVRAPEATEGADGILGADSELRTSIEALAKTLRELGEPPETTVRHVKVIRDEAMQLVRNRPLLLRDYQPVTDALVRWAIGAYYAP